MNKRKHMIAAGLLVAGVIVAAAAAAPGGLDQGFGEHGVVTTATAPGAGSDFQNGLAVLKDGRILVGGESDTGLGGFQWRISRYTKKGALDSGFGSGGAVLTSMSSAGDMDEVLWQLALQADGKIVAAGEAQTATGGFDVALARFSPDGTLDTSFGTGGRVTTAIGPGTRRDTAFHVEIDSSGSIVVGGHADMGPGAGRINFMVARYNSDGTLDGSFGSGGIAVTAVAPGDNADQAVGMAIDPAGRIVLSGGANMGTGGGGLNFAAARYNPNGSLDASFGSGGIVTTAVAPGDNFDRAIAGVAIDAAGRIVASGLADSSGNFDTDLALVRLTPNGSLDSSFGSGGKVTTNVGPGGEFGRDLLVQPTGRIVVGGGTDVDEVNGDFLVARYNADGSLDSTFGSGGVVVTPTSSGDDESFDLALQSDAKVIAAGECEQPSTGRDVCVARYKAGDDD